MSEEARRGQAVQASSRVREDDESISCDPRKCSHVNFLLVGVGLVVAGAAFGQPADPFELEAQIQAAVAEAGGEVPDWALGLLAAAAAQISAQLVNATTTLQTKRPWVRNVLNIIRILAADVGKSGERVSKREILTPDSTRGKKKG